MAMMMTKSRDLFMTLMALFLCLFGFSCSGKAPIVPPPGAETGEVRLVRDVYRPKRQKAPEGLFKQIPPQSLFKDKAHVDDRTEYEKYLSGFRGGPVSSPPLMKAGKMHEPPDFSLPGPPDRFAFLYPEAEFSLNDEISLVETRYNDAEYQKVIETGEDILRRGVSSEERFRLSRIMASSYAATGEAEKGMALLREFLEDFPGDENIPAVRALMKRLGRGLRRDGEIRAIGCLLPLSGPYEIYGRKALKGIELALMTLGARENRPRVKIIIKDTESDPDVAVRSVAELDKAGAMGIVGPITPLLQAAAESQSREVPIITLTQKDGVADIGDYVFRNFLTPLMQVEALVAHSFKKLDARRFAILYPNENYGIAFMELFRDQVMAYGGSIAGQESYDAADTDFAEPIGKLARLYYERLERAPEMTEEEALHYHAWRLHLDPDYSPPPPPRRRAP
ncbi:hypothetical protein EPICR_60049 [Candidatus Desulfarcum epimagneticum]|uniref:Leucine-binding protein domain-containing protein n=1 Tax=uncultured Desulfobacteraceae bacterium TaxID=218296 RepID=A0A484HIR3_9BACT|nr:hypothetical protein EPICR_60049 [uncultured Desulfobacteraceae bacterium]